MIENKIYIEDMGSTNGSWVRLSKEQTQSGLFELLDGMIFKIGSNLTYTCKKNCSI